MKTFDPIPYAVPVFVLAILIELLWTRYKQRHQYRANDTIACLSTSIISTTIGALGFGFITYSYAFIYQHYHLIPLSELSYNKQIYCLLLLVIIQDGFYYWFHRAAHRINFLWAGHIVHHSSEEFNFAVALRQSTFQQFVSWPIYLPLALIGFPLAWLSFVISMNLIYQFWVHTREVDRFPAWIEAIFNTPSHHRVHHGTNPQYLDKNYGGIFIIWDKLFGTFESEKEEVRYGITTPINSYNPVWINVHHYFYLIETSKRAPDWYQVVLFWLSPPDWKAEWFSAEKESLTQPGQLEV
jgi:alkylglycerol monooxygenase